MYKQISITVICSLLFGIHSFAQKFRFTEAIKNPSGAIADIIQDKQGILWFAAFEKGLIRYDGMNTKTYMNDSRNLNSIGPDPAVRVFADRNNIIWVGTLGSGLERFDPATNRFTHFRHDPKDASSISSDTITAVLEDRSGNLWIGSSNGLSLLERKTGKFTNYKYDPNNRSGVSHQFVYEIYEDKNGTIWMYTATFNVRQGIVDGALNRFDRSTGKFTRYVKDPSNPGKILPGPIRSLYEDRKNNFWISSDSGLYNLDRKTGKFTRYYPDPFNSSPLGQTPLAQRISSFVRFVSEDSSGALWVGVGGVGLIRYDPDNKTSIHFGTIYVNNKRVSAKDTTTGFTSSNPIRAISSREGLFWVYDDRSVYNLNYNKTIIPF